MEIIITNKAAYSIIFLLAFSLFVVAADASEFIDINKAYHSLEQLVDSKDRKIDLDDNGQVDYADLTNGVKWIDVEHMGFTCPENSYLVGYEGNAPVCVKLGLVCEVKPVNVVNCEGQKSFGDQYADVVSSYVEHHSELDLGGIILEKNYGVRAGSGDLIGMTESAEDLFADGNFDRDVFRGLFVDNNHVNTFLDKNYDVNPGDSLMDLLYGKEDRIPKDVVLSEIKDNGYFCNFVYMTFPQHNIDQIGTKRY
ncbi:hypothetical protein KY321_03665 [Candidatus Woesearchaeota archaeon]|nr:hypothetical protein [Candidatus Woesearchaeota archaeon]